MSRKKPPESFRPEELPVAWFGVALIAIDQRGYNGAIESQRQLDRLGPKLDRKRNRTVPHRQAPRAEGRGMHKRERPDREAAGAVSDPRQSYHAASHSASPLTPDNDDKALPEGVRDLAHVLGELVGILPGLKAALVNQARQRTKRSSNRLNGHGFREHHT